MNVARPLTKNIVLDCDARTARHVGDLAISQSTVSQSRQSRHKSRSAEATGTTGGRAGLSADASAADSSPQTQYVRQLGEKLVATIPSHYSWPFEFHVLAQKEVNAFALRGGPMFVNLGTITAASNEAELAGVMAHEMAHVYMQHSAKQAAKKSKPEYVGRSCRRSSQCHDRRLDRSALSNGTSGRLGTHQPTVLPRRRIAGRRRRCHHSL